MKRLRLLHLMLAAIAMPMVARAQASGAPEHFTVMADGHPLAVWGRHATAPRGSILLIHGRTWSARPDFDLQVPGEQRSVMAALAARGYDTYALDMRGYGATPRDRTGWLTPTRAAKDVNEVLLWIAARSPAGPKPVLLGWSIGSLVAQLAAQLHPEQVSALILYGYPKDPDSKFDADDSPSRPPRERNTAAGAASDFITPGSISRRAIAAYVAAALRTDPVLTDWRNVDEFNVLDPALVRMPTLLLQGEHDPGPSDADLRQFLAHGHRRQNAHYASRRRSCCTLLEDTHPGCVDADHQLP